MLEKENRLNVYILDIYLNNDLKEYVKVRYNLLNDKNIKKCLNKIDVLIVSNVENIQEGLEIIDNLLSMGREIICIIDLKEKSYLANYLKKDGAFSI